MYSINEIANYIINYCIDNELEMNNLKLQKILYYSNIRTIKELHVQLFTDPGKITLYGIMYESIYNKFCTYSAINIFMKQEEPNIEDKYKYIIEAVINEFKNYSTIQMVNKNKEDLNIK